MFYHPKVYYKIKEEVKTFSYLSDEIPSNKKKYILAKQWKNGKRSFICFRLKGELFSKNI